MTFNICVAVPFGYRNDVRCFWQQPVHGRNARIPLQNETHIRTRIREVVGAPKSTAWYDRRRGGRSIVPCASGQISIRMSLGLRWLTPRSPNYRRV